MAEGLPLKGSSCRFKSDSGYVYEYYATVVRVIDGDTFVADWDLGAHAVLQDTHFRIRGIDAPERKDYKKHYESKVFATDLLEHHQVVVSTHKPPVGYEPKSLERYVVDVMIHDLDLATVMVDNGYAVVWNYRKGDPHPEQ